jgi:hypothetical protein
MSVNFTTTWLKAPPQIKGQDPLGVRAPCENIYSQLLPGITNVTDRADLYAFYPWLIWSLEKHEGALKKRPFFETLRRSECLHTLIGNWHADHTGEESWLHGSGLVGRDKLLPALAELENGKSLKLSTFAALDEESEHRYFKNKLGGLGQYYLGPLGNLRIMEGDIREIKYVTERGGVLAQSYDEKVNRRLFFATLEKDRINIDDLKNLVEFCPCYLTSSAVRRDTLTNLFFNQPSPFYESSNDNRRDSLFLILHLAEQLAADNSPALSSRDLVDLFRACTYSTSLASGAPWRIPSALTRNHDGWRTYATNELLSIAVQGFFWAGLSELFIQGLVLETSEDYGEWFTSVFAKSALGNTLDEEFSDAVLRFKDTLPSLTAWNNEHHEVQLGWKLNDLRRRFDPVSITSEVLKTATELFISLAARTESADSAYVGFVQTRNYLDFYPINLDSFSQNGRTIWSTMSVGKVLAWLAKEWGICAHFRVALRKLRYESRDTFKIKPTERGLEVVEAPLPGFSNPRLTQAIQILRDLGMLRVEADFLITTDLGKTILRSLND